MGREALQGEKKAWRGLSDGEGKTHPAKMGGRVGREVRKVRGTDRWTVLGQARCLMLKDR